ncbi:MAG: hypothetical protein EPO19_11305 [Betaproteobacteria bacterium]|nr:MAG: hypothetical protein EPO19_11305 [Betaproteobacteria bacterium]
MPNPKIPVVLASAKPRYAYGEPLALTYMITNKTSKPIWVVNDPDRVTAWKEGATKMGIVCGETRPGFTAAYFDFRAPILRRLAPGAEVKRQIRIGMPLTTTVVDKGIASPVQIPLDGDVSVVLNVGYGTGSFKPATADPYGEYLAWQQIADSKPLKLKLSPPGPILPHIP